MPREGIVACLAFRGRAGMEKLEVKACPPWISPVNTPDHPPLSPSAFFAASNIANCLEITMPSVSGSPASIQPPSRG